MRCFTHLGKQMLQSLIIVILTRSRSKGKFYILGYRLLHSLASSTFHCHVKWNICMSYSLSVLLLCIFRAEPSACAHNYLETCWEQYLFTIGNKIIPDVYEQKNGYMWPHSVVFYSSINKWPKSECGPILQYNVE